MKDTIKKPALLLVAAVSCLCLLTTLSGCRQANTAPDTGAAEAKITYTNLDSAAQQEELAKLLENAGVAAARRDALLQEITAFNASVPAEALTSGWETAGVLDKKYDPYELQEEYANANPDFIGYNCRITAYSVMNDFLVMDTDVDVTSGQLLFELEALEENPSAVPSEEDTKRFLLLFSDIPTVRSDALEEHLTVLTDNWSAKGIKFIGNENIHLITVFFHDMPDESESILFAGHAGVLLETDKDLYFLEKIAFQEPYRLLRFADRAALNDYLMAQYDTDWDQPTADPFIMEDDHLMDGYRKLN